MTQASTTRPAPRFRTPCMRGYEDAETTGDWLRIAVNDPELLTVVLFCLLGLVVTFAAIWLSPDFGAGVDQLAGMLG